VHDRVPFVEGCEGTAVHGLLASDAVAIPVQALGVASGYRDRRKAEVSDVGAIQVIRGWAGKGRTQVRSRR
jgi:hypothetical protein